MAAALGSPLLDVSSEADRIGALDEEEALRAEIAFVAERAALLGAAAGAPRDAIAVCVSGGGIRSAAVACGLLWRLSVVGALRRVEHISCVSGGGFVGAAYVSQIVAMAAAAPPREAAPAGEAPPPSGGGAAAARALDGFYAAALEATVLRMQARCNWLVGTTPRERFTALAAVPALAALAPIVWLAALTVPLAMWADLGAGHALRALACEPDARAARRDAAALLLAGWEARVCAASVAALLVIGVGELVPYASRFLARRAAAPRYAGWRAWKACHQLASRSLLVATLLLATNALALALQQRELGVLSVPSPAPMAAAARAELGDALACACAQYAAGGARGPHGARACVDDPTRWGVRWPPPAPPLARAAGGPAGARGAGGPAGARGAGGAWARARAANSSDAEEAAAACAARAPTELAATLERLAVPTAVYAAYSVLATCALLLLLAVALGGAGVASLMCAAVGPLVLVYSVARVAQWRVFGPLTGQPLRGLGLEGVMRRLGEAGWFGAGAGGGGGGGGSHLSAAAAAAASNAAAHGADLPSFSLAQWQALQVCTTAVTLLLLPLLPRCGSILRIHFTRRLVRAFFASGADFAWEAAASCAHAPQLTLGCTISDYQRPADARHFAPFSIGTHFLGSARSGYLPIGACSQPLTVGMALGISSAALDPTGDMLLAAKPDRASTRFWLTVLGLTLGDWLKFGAPRGRATDKRARAARWRGAHAWFAREARARGDKGARRAGAGASVGAGAAALAPASAVVGAAAAPGMAGASGEPGARACAERAPARARAPWSRRWQRLPAAPDASQWAELLLCATILLVLLALNFEFGGARRAGPPAAAPPPPSACALVGPAWLFLGAALGGYWVCSFFGSFDRFRWAQSGHVIRQLRSVLLLVHKAVGPPPFLRLSDGGLCENTGLLALLARRHRWIVAVDASHDPRASLATVRNALRAAADRRLCSLYDPECPGRDVDVALAQLARGERSHLRLAIRYGWAAEEELGYRGELFLIKVGAPRADDAPVPPPISADELARGPAVPPTANARLPFPRAELRGCCCESCHALCSRAGCGERFPFYSSAAQCFTPALFSAFARLGYELATPTVDHLLRRQRECDGEAAGRRHEGAPTS
ncbi:hypothetical protein KFE25_013241 [Diacronema lutheri]|uniref:PNPLA domain-containing protein n=2 Tax=Diacronema lutheri TaxID=2081491 RepID=A0A8J5XBQ4_DIALT|nr:hypothetical protein KFE25_013241 [Diacronema lutheri]